MQIFDMYRMVKMVSKLTDRSMEVHGDEFTTTGYGEWHPFTWAVEHEYKVKHKVTTVTAARICAAAITNGYLHGDTITHEGKETDTVCVTHDGRRLIDNLWIFPWWGLLREWVKEDRFLLTATLSIATFLLGYVLGHVGQIVTPLVSLLERIIKL